MEYNGITKETLFLLADNRFRDSKAFYEEHKEEIKQGITVPMRQIAGIIAENMLKVDPLIYSNPVYMVSRIRRDTRFTRDKSLYRDNMWIMFMRDKHQWPNYPCFWFEVTQQSYNIGIGIYAPDTSFVQTLRKAIRERTDEFAEAVKKCEKTGALLCGEPLKKVPAGCPEGMEEYYRRKRFGFIAYEQNFDDLADEKIIGIIRRYYKAYTPLYKFLLTVSDEFCAEKEQEIQRRRKENEEQRNK